MTSSDKETYRPGYEMAAERIATLIRSEGFQPGDRLPTEAALGERLGLGRTVIREAVKMLSAAGLIRTRRGSGLFVSASPTFATAAIDLSMPVDPEHVLSLLEYRTLIEVQAASLAAQRITPRELRSLCESLAISRSGAEAGDAERFLNGDLGFHRQIAEATRNAFVVQTILTTFRMQHRAIDPVLGPGLPGSMLASADQHEIILEAIRQGEPEQAAGAMRTHLDLVAATYQQAVRRRLGAGTSA